MKTIAPGCLAVLLVLPLAAAASPPAAPLAPAGVGVRPIPGGQVYVQARGLVLYTYLADSPGKSNCNDDCEKTWPPLAAPADAQPMGDWKPIVRDNGQRQWAVSGKPVYTFISDAEPGIATGAAVPGWQVATYTAPPPTVDRPAGITLQKSGEAYVLADDRGRTLYVPRSADCALACGPDWSMVRAPSLARGYGDWGLVRRDDGAVQWTYRGQPLYRYEGDAKAGDRRGEAAGDWVALAAR